jgi:DNA-binding IclR family transcriptional regulator
MPEDSAPPSGEDLDQALLTLLSLLWEAKRETPDKPWPLAKLSKRSGVHMSTLLRQLNVLVGAGLVSTAARSAGGDYAELTPAGIDLCAALFT